MKSIKTKLLILVLGCIVFSSAAVGGASILNSRRVVSKDSAQAMNLLCENSAEEIDSLFARIEQSVETLTVYAVQQVDDLNKFKTNADYVSEYSEGLKDVAVNAAKNTEGAMAVYIRYNPDFTDPESGIFCSKSSEYGDFASITPTNITDYDPSDIEHVGWFYEPQKKKNGTWMEPYYNKNLDVKMISYIVPFYIQNTFVGVVGMDIDFSVLENIIDDTNIYETGNAFLADKDARVVYHHELDARTDLTAYNDGEFKELGVKLKKNSAGNQELIKYTYEKIDKKAVFRELKNGMRLVLSAPESEIDQQANSLIRQIVVAVVLIIGIVMMITIFFTRRLVKPLLELTAAAKKIAEGDMSVSITHQSDDEIGLLAESFRQTVAHLNRYISYINGLAYRDSLTGVKNKTAYLEMIQEIDKTMRIGHSEYAVVVFDINGLKQVNDTMGHDFGDILIMNSSRLICETFQKSPVYRIGGDEFVVLLQNEDYERYAELLNQLRDRIELYNSDPQNEIKISVARGIGIYSVETDFSYNDVFKRADSAMYRNKAEMKSKREVPETEEV